MAETKPKQNQKSRKIPERRCVGCVGTFPKKDLIRVVRSPEGEISIDFTGKKSGRGAYLCKSEACFRKAKKSGILKRSLECEISEEIYTELEKEIRLAEAENE
ncbi:MAG: YlxR family protein [Clostridia bacterium]|nr:YlxR family protein [Clostridia bacterium]MBR3998797.1 YlxR family protein [Clostridia bacterium]